MTVLNKFIKETEGATSVIIAITMPLLIGFIATAVNVGHLQVHTSKAEDNLKTVCEAWREYTKNTGETTVQKAVDFLIKEMPNEKRLVDKITDNNQQKDAVIDLKYVKVTATTSNIVYSINTQIDYPIPFDMFGSITPSNVKVSRECYIDDIDTKSPSVLVFEEKLKEIDHYLKKTNTDWFTLPENQFRNYGFMNWEMLNNGLIEFQQSGLVVNSPDGLPIIELDSHYDNSNTGLVKRIFLYPGKHILSFNYYTRSNDLKSNTISVYFDKATQSTPLNKVTTIRSTKQSIWENFQVLLNVRSSQSYKITFIGQGTQDTEGGLLHGITLRNHKDNI